MSGSILTDNSEYIPKDVRNRFYYNDQSPLELTQPLPWEVWF